jgi:hypothetical protein
MVDNIDPYVPHRKVVSGVHGDVCGICGDALPSDNFRDSMGIGIFINPVERQKELKIRHTVDPEELHLYQTTDGVEGMHCEHCGYSKNSFVHKDFSKYDEMLKDFQDRKDAKENARYYYDGRIPSASAEACVDYKRRMNEPKPKKARTDIHPGFYFFAGSGVGGAFIAIVALLTGHIS